MFNRRLTFILGISIFLLIIFDAFQQKFYIDTFNLNPEGSSFLYIFKSHSLRWFLWLAGSIPYTLFAKKIFNSETEEVSTKDLISLIGVVASSVLLMIFAISLMSMLLFNDEVSFSLFSEWFIFVFFQKTVSFSLASSLMVLLVYTSSTKQVIEAQWIEIKNLKSSVTTSSALSSDPNITIRIGNKLKLIPLGEVTWIEADDYCVKIHTQGKAYTLRKSLKSLETELAPFQFIRVHRKALLNLAYMDQVDFNSSIIKLQDLSELPLSKSGAQILRKVLKASSI